MKDSKRERFFYYGIRVYGDIDVSQNEKIFGTAEEI